VVTQYPLHYAAFRYQLSTHHPLNHIPIYAKYFYDTLNGGTGNDQLKGGAGVDVYQFTGIYGLDTINDSDGGGKIMVDNNPQLMGGKQIAHNVYYNDTTKYTYTLSGTVGDQTLVIRKDGDSNQIIVQHWSASKNLGITLDDNVTPPPAPQATRTIVGDLKPQDFEDVLASGLQEAANNNELRMAA
jgi:Ca2+-binding RTX toxin-like protein